PSTSVCTLRRSVNGGRTATSTRSKSLSLSAKAIFWTSAIASRWLRFIFQLPAMSGFLTSVLQSGESGKGLALQVFQAGSATGGDVREAVFRQAERADRGRRVAAAHHGEGVGGDQRLGHRAGAA